MDDVLGDDVLGYEDLVGLKLPNLGVLRAALAKRQRISLPAKPAWRRQLAPGVPYPGEGEEILPLTPNAGAGVFTAALTSINFQARPQAPFRPHRLVVTVRRSGAAGTIIQCTGLFVGRNLQQAELGNWDVETMGPTAFQMMMKLNQAPPGVLISLPCVTAGAAIAGADTVAVSMYFLGQSIQG